VFAGGKHNKDNKPMKIGGKLRFISIEQASEKFQKAVVLSILSITYGKRVSCDLFRIQYLSDIEDFRRKQAVKDGRFLCPVYHTLS
jgi:hypothetical protein